MPELWEEREDAEEGAKGARGEGTAALMATFGTAHGFHLEGDGNKVPPQQCQHTNPKTSKRCGHWQRGEYCGQHRPESEIGNLPRTELTAQPTSLLGGLAADVYDEDRSDNEQDCSPPESASESVVSRFIDQAEWSRVWRNAVSSENLQDGVRALRQLLGMLRASSSHLLTHVRGEKVDDQPTAGARKRPSVRTQASHHTTKVMETLRREGHA